MNLPTLTTLTLEALALLLIAWGCFEAGRFAWRGE